MPGRIRENEFINLIQIVCVCHIVLRLGLWGGFYSVLCGTITKFILEKIPWAIMEETTLNEA